MIKRFFTFISIVLMAPTAIEAQDVDTTAIKEILKEQEAAWNSNDIESFMQYYWHSEELTFVSKKGVTKGWEETRSRYYKNYPNKDTMGTLSFEIIDLNMLSEQSALLIGSWHLERPVNGNIGGFFSLTWQKIKGKWRIISDHTS